MIYPLLTKAPINHFSKEFITFLYENNPVIYEDEAWLVIANCKYNKPNAPWLTAFYKLAPKDPWQNHLKSLIEIWGDWEWIKKAASQQTIKRFHIHLIKK